MIIDERTEIADAVALNTGGAGTYNIGDVIDTAGMTQWPTGSSGLDGPQLVALVDAAATSGGAATLQFQLVSDSSSSMSSPTVHFTSGVFALAELTAGRMLFAWPLGGPDFRRYLGVRQITGTAAFTAGRINLFLAADASSLGRPYAKAKQ